MLACPSTQIMLLLKQNWLVILVVTVFGLALVFMLFRLNNKHRKRLQQQLDHDSHRLRYRSAGEADLPEVNNE